MDPYQTSTRNFGKSKARIGRAPVDAVDAKLHTIGTEIQSLCIDLAQPLSAEDRESKQALLNKLVSQQSNLRFERDEIIRTFFYR